MHSIAWWPTLILAVIATFTDLRGRRIPNWLTVPFLLAGLICSVVFHGLSGLGQSVMGMALGAFLMGILCLLGGMGMGDLKLCAAVGAWIGPGQLVIALVFMGLIGGVMALCWALAGGFFGDLMKGTGDLVFGVRSRGLRPHPTLVLDNPLARKMPYAPAIAIGTILSFFSS